MVLLLVWSRASPQAQQMSRSPESSTVSWGPNSSTRSWGDTFLAACDGLRGRVAPLPVLCPLLADRRPPRNRPMPPVRRHGKWSRLSGGFGQECAQRWAPLGCRLVGHNYWSNVQRWTRSAKGTTKSNVQRWTRLAKGQVDGSPIYYSVVRYECMVQQVHSYGIRINTFTSLQR